MPRTRAVDANHGVMTDHSIPRIAGAAAAVPAAGALVPFGGKGDDRAMGLAYAELGDKRAREYLLRAVPRDWPVLLRLAVLLSSTPPPLLEAMACNGAASPLRYAL